MRARPCEVGGEKTLNPKPYALTFTGWYVGVAFLFKGLHVTPDLLRFSFKRTSNEFPAVRLSQLGGWEKKPYAASRTK